MEKKKIGVGRCLDNNILAYVIPENYEDYIEDSFYVDEKCKFIEYVDFYVDDSGKLFVNDYAVQPGTVLLYDAHLNLLVDIYSSVEEAQEHYYVPGVLD